jgi:3,4-dihydroxy 2-butanone 4-phosphate synthase/GTP cyclohydrolase II
MKMSNKTVSLREVVDDIKNGKPIIVVDSYDRENEGDLVLAAEKATVENLAFIARYARGIMCIPCEGRILDKFSIPMSPSNSRDKLQTPFTVSIDAVKGVSTGVSVSDRLVTIGVLLDPHSTEKDIAYPGHLFPLRPRPGLLKERQGHTEASIDLMLYSGMTPMAIICEIMNDNGSMARMPDLEVFAETHNLKIVSIDDIKEEIYG